MDRRSRPGRAVRLARTDAALPGPAVRPGSSSAEDQRRQGPRGRGAARPPPVHEGPQRAQRSSGKDAGAARPSALFSLPRAPQRSLALWPQAPQARRGTVAPLPPPPLRRPCRWRAAPSPLAPSVKSSVLCLAAAIVWRGPVPCLERRPQETEGPCGVSGCGL